MRSMVYRLITMGMVPLFHQGLRSTVNTSPLTRVSFRGMRMSVHCGLTLSKLIISIVFNCRRPNSSTETVGAPGIFFTLSNN